MNVAFQYTMGWVGYNEKWVFLWAVRITGDWGLPCYIDPYTYVNVPAGIDGLEFV